MATKPVNSGRKPLDKYAPSVITHIRLTELQRLKLAKLGGAEWVRRMIDYAYESSSR